MSFLDNLKPIDNFLESCKVTAQLIESYYRMKERRKHFLQNFFDIKMHLKFSDYSIKPYDHKNPNNATKIKEELKISLLEIENEFKTDRIIDKDEGYNFKKIVNTFIDNVIYFAETDRNLFISIKIIDSGENGILTKISLTEKEREKRKVIAEESIKKLKDNYPR